MKVGWTSVTDVLISQAKSAPTSCIALPGGATVELNNFDLNLIGGEDILI